MKAPFHKDGAQRGVALVWHCDERLRMTLSGLRAELIINMRN